jgi:hypothetical protein
MEMDSAGKVVGGAERRRLLPKQGWIGLGLVLICWPLNWMLPGTRTSWLFFPLWLGFALTVDGLVYLRKGTSLLARSWKRYVGLFLISAPAWWLFEAINLRTQNWFYQGVDQFSPLAYFLLASLNFSTVIPAVFGMAELAGSFDFIRRMKPWLVIGDDRRTTLAFFCAGWVMLALLLAWPLYFFPFVWISVYFITEPLNVWLGNHSLVEGTRRGDWRAVVSLFVGVLVTGFFWEMWNFYAYPKWIYNVPGVGFLHVFEMPLLGYGGYLPFALELCAMYHLVMGFLGQKNAGYLQL